MNRQMINSSTGNFLGLFAIFLFFLGLYIGYIIWHINPSKRVTQIISCEGIEEDFLKELGFQDQNSCVELNLALNKQYIDDCLSKIKSSDNEYYGKKLLNLCVYHRFEIDDISMSSKYMNYRKNKKID